MKIMKGRKKLLAITLVLSIILSLPVLAADTTKAGKGGVLEYDEIKQRVLDENLQLKSAQAAMHKISNNISDKDRKDAEDALYGAYYSTNGVLESLKEIIQGASSPEIKVIANAAAVSLEMTVRNFTAQIDSLDESFGALEDQLDFSKSSFEQAQVSLANTAQNMFVLYHQMDNNLKKLEKSRNQLADQLALVNKNIELGLAAKIDALDLETSLLELDASRTSLLHQKDALLLQLKGFIGLTYKDELALGEMPDAEKSFIESIEFEKDLDSAVENAKSIKTKELEMKNSSITGNQRKYELQIKEQDAALAFTKKYHTLVEAKDQLLVSESKLKAAELKLGKGRISREIGQISESQLNTLLNEVETLRLEVKTNSASLFIETENYKAMKAGML